MTQHFIQHT